MNVTATKKPRSVLTHRRGLVPNHQEGTVIVTDPTGPLTLIGNPDDDGPIINALEGQFLQRRDDCPLWCVGHRPHTDGDDNRCMATYGRFVELDDDFVQLYAIKDPGAAPVVTVSFGDRDERGGKFTAAKLRALITDLTDGLHLIDPPKAA